MSKNSQLSHARDNRREDEAKEETFTTTFNYLNFVFNNNIFIEVEVATLNSKTSQSTWEFVGRLIRYRLDSVLRHPGAALSYAPFEWNPINRWMTQLWAQSPNSSAQGYVSGLDVVLA